MRKLIKKISKSGIFKKKQLERRSEERYLLSKDKKYIKGAIERRKNIRPIEFTEISENGLKFKVAFNPRWEHSLPIDTYITLRLYFSAGVYVPIKVRVAHKKETILGPHQKSTILYGCEIDTINSPKEAVHTLYDLVDFNIKNLKEDHGESKKLWSFKN